MVRAHQTPRGQAAAALGGLVMAIWFLTGTVLTSVFAVGLVMTVVIAAEGPGPDPDPNPGGLAFLVVACGLLGLAMLGSYSSVRRVLQRSRGPRMTPRRRS